MNHDDSLDIAIIGMAGQFPGARDVDQLWTNLREGKESITRLPPEALAGFPALASNKDFVRARGIVEGADRFDAGFFGMTSAEATITNPQFRLFLEASWTAMESAGYVPDAYPGIVSCFGGSWRSGTEYLWSALNAAAAVYQSNPFSLMRGNDPDFLTSLVAQKLNFQGESIGVQATCPAGLVGMLLGVQSLLSGQCDLALAGASCVPWPQELGYLYLPNSPLSPDGTCRPFDRRGRGAPVGGGVGVVVLKRLEDARADRDTILAVVKGISLNNDGARRANFNTPTVEGQTQVIARALALSGVSADTIGYVECNGLGTLAADAVEVEALSRAYTADNARRGYCALGATKANIGHAGLAAGMAGLFRAIQALRHRELPPAINCEEVNPDLRLEQTPFFLPRQAQRWEGDRLRAAVNSFGGGGQNLHLLLEEAPKSAPLPTPRIGSQVVTLSAHTRTALAAQRAQLLSFMKGVHGRELEHIAYTLNTGRKGLKHRWAAIVSDKDDLVVRLAAPDGAPGVRSGEASRSVAEGPDAAAVSGLARGPDGLAQLAERWVHGEAVAWSGLYAERACARARLPTYPYEKDTYRLVDP